MIPALSILWRYRKLAGAILAIIAISVLAYRLHHAGVKAGRAEIQAKWDADTAHRDKVSAEAIAKEAAKAEAARKRNDEVMRNVNAQLLAIAADRDSLGRMYLQASGEVRRLAASQATDKLGLVVTTGIAARSAALEEAFDAYDRACQRDAVRFKALQDEIRPQL